MTVVPIVEVIEEPVLKRELVGLGFVVDACVGDILNTAAGDTGSEVASVVATRPNRRTGEVEKLRLAEAVQISGDW